MDTFIDVAEEDLERIYLLATVNRQKRTLGSVVCRDIMTRNVTSVSPQTPLSAVWEVLPAQYPRRAGRRQDGPRGRQHGGDLGFPQEHRLELEPPRPPALPADYAAPGAVDGGRHR
ncbi:MAG: hypothetical protein IPO79_18090 [Flavobacteriales bacterium]|nr:hypothetical protein [Flavobacteriales bacterium]